MKFYFLFTVLFFNSLNIYASEIETPDEAPIIMIEKLYNAATQVAKMSDFPTSLQDTTLACSNVYEDNKMIGPLPPLKRVKKSSSGPLYPDSEILREGVSGQQEASDLEMRTYMTSTKTDLIVNIAEDGWTHRRYIRRNGAYIVMKNTYESDNYKSVMSYTYCWNK